MERRFKTESWLLVCKHKFMVPDFFFKRERWSQMRESQLITCIYRTCTLFCRGGQYIISVYYQIIIFLQGLIKTRIRINPYCLFYPYEHINKEILIMHKCIPRAGWILSWAEEEEMRPRRKGGSLGPSLLSLPVQTWLPRFSCVSSSIQERAADGGARDLTSICFICSLFPGKER